MPIDLNALQAANDKFTPQQVITALKASSGIKLVAARALGCSPSTITSYIERYKPVEAAWKQCRDDFVDLAQSQLVTGVKDGNMTAVIFTLKTLGKHLGYSERHEVSGPDGGPVPIQESDLSQYTDDELYALREIHERAVSRARGDQQGVGSAPPE